MNSVSRQAFIFSRTTFLTAHLALGKGKARSHRENHCNRTYSSSLKANTLLNNTFAFTLTVTLAFPACISSHIAPHFGCHQRNMLYEQRIKHVGIEFS